MNVSGSVQLRKGKRGAVWYAKYRLPSGAQRMKKIGPAWTEKGGRPKQGYFTRRDAMAKLDEILTDARQGRIPDPGERSGKTFGDATAELLRYVEQERPGAPRRCATIATPPNRRWNRSSERTHR